MVYRFNYVKEKFMTSVDKTSSSQGTPQSSENFKSYADRLNATIPEKTTTIEEKKRVIEVKKKLIAHPQCPDDAKNQLRKDIEILNKEISRLEAQNSSIFE